jgi:hypothetical protein
MKKSKFFLATGALVLAVSAIFATKANKKLSLNFSTGISSKDGSSFYMRTLTGNGWLTCFNTGHPAIVTVSTTTGTGTLVFRTQLVTNVSGLKTKLFY